MPICSFYFKTNIVIPTCTSDILPPVLPLSLLTNNVEIECEWVGKSGSAQGGCQMHDTGNEHFFPVLGGKNVVYECRGIWGLGLMSMYR